MSQVLDVACGAKAFYFDHSDPRVTFCDVDPRDLTLCDGRRYVVSPDVVADFRALPFGDESFDTVIFDPPHLIRGQGWQAQKYGVLRSDWKSELRDGFAECFRVLKPTGVLVFKWSDVQVHLSEILPLALPHRPLIGNKKAKTSGTHWVLFLKEAR
jgi:SAM-dependent methyltransferase